MNRSIRGSGLLVALVVVGALGVLAFQPGGPLGSPVDAISTGATGRIPTRPADAVAMTVEHVHDGDTLFLRTDQPNALVPSTDAVKVRLIGIDTPEIGDAAECFGDEATLALRALVPDGSTVWVSADREPTDRFDRSLFYLWTDDGRFVNYELVSGGAAESLVIPPNDAYYPLLRSVEDAATAAGTGMWGVC
ncbi:thermonuclease family protein [Cryobacterium fucosi]|nr:thermonuclease family protein [Cryobacterium fucosi]